MDADLDLLPHSPCSSPLTISCPWGRRTPTGGWPTPRWSSSASSRDHGITSDVRFALTKRPGFRVGV